MLSNSFENSDFANKVNRHKQVHQDIWRRVNYENACQCSVKIRSVIKVSSQNPEIRDYKTFFPASCISAKRDTFNGINDVCLKT